MNGLKRGKKLIVGANSIFLILSLGMLIIGVLMKTRPDIVDPVLLEMARAIARQVHTAQGAANVHVLEKRHMERIVGVIHGILQGASTALVVIGSVLIAVALAAILGVCCSSGCFLALYILALLLLLLAQSGFVIMVFLRGNLLQLDSHVKSAMRTMLRLEEFQPEPSNDTITTLWVGLMDQLDCCGVENYEDFNRTQWRPPPTLPWITPLACCKNVTTAFQLLAKGTEYIPCALFPTDLNSNFKKGCFEALRQRITSSTMSKWVFIVACTLIFFLEVALVISALCVIKGESFPSSVGPM